MDDEELEILSDMRPGLIQLEIGVQSTNDATIQEVSRTMRLDRLARAVDRVECRSQYPSASGSHRRSSI